MTCCFSSSRCAAGAGTNNRHSIHEIRTANPRYQSSGPTSQTTHSGMVLYLLRKVPAPANSRIMPMKASASTRLMAKTPLLGNGEREGEEVLSAGEADQGSRRVSGIVPFLLFPRYAIGHSHARCHRRMAVQKQLSC